MAAKSIAAPTTITTVSVTSSASAGQDTGQTCRYITVVSSVDCFIRFGATSSVAATTSSWPLYAKQERQFDLRFDSKFFSVIRASTDGTLYWYVSEGAG